MKKILVVDDNVVNLKVIDKILKSNSEYKSVLVPNGQKALQFLDKTVPDLILLDVLMPDMDGFAVLAEIKKRPALAGVPVLFLTADEDSGLQEKITAAGAQGMLRKPFEKDALLNLIGQYLA
ncbi:MAG: response regulator [Anaerovibrio sp.]|uniref:response regulator n=1 Tax=Anaerovibrio sp. TaxID=1872532 RepID=UPI0025D85AF2|nr:response regulator [Anaerovibrio sp.]MCR5176786.1 response regulator [Anaerovibrio sp.]